MQIIDELGTMAALRTFFRICYRCLAVLAVLAGVLWILLLTPRVQTFLVGHITRAIERNTGMRLQIGGVDFRPVRSLVLNDVLLRDVGNDTLVFCQDLQIRADSFSWGKKSFHISEIVFDRAVFNLWVEDGTNNTNIEILMDSVDRRRGRPAADTSASPGASWLVGLDRITLKNSRFTYREEIYEPLEYGVNWTDVDCSNLNVEVTDLDLDASPMTFRVNGLGLDEKSGLKIRDMSGTVRAGSSNLLITDCHFNLERSSVDLLKLEYNWVPDRHDWKYFTTRMQQYYELGPSSVSFIDLAYFNEVLRGITNTVKCSGIVSNTVNRLEGHDLYFELGDRSVFQGSFTSSGLPDVWHTQYDIELHAAHLSPKDLETVYLPWFDMNIPVPSPLYRLPSVNFDTITFNGSFLDFIVRANCTNPELGGRLSFCYRDGEPALPDTDIMNGSFNFPQVDFGLFSGLEWLGNGSFSGSYAGIWDNAGPDFKVSSTVRGLEVKNGRLGGVGIEMAYAGDRLDLVAEVRDRLAEGQVRLDRLSRGTSELTEMSGFLRLPDLAALGTGIAGGEEEAETSFGFSMDRRSDSISTRITLRDLKYAGTGGEFAVDGMYLADDWDGQRNVTRLESDLLDVDISGNYREIHPSEFLEQLLYNYLPACADGGMDLRQRQRLLDTYDFAYDIRIKDINRVLAALYPPLRISAGTRLAAGFGGPGRQLRLSMRADTVSYGGLSLTGPRVEMAGTLDSLQVDCSAGRASYGDNYRLCNVRSRLRLADDCMQSRTDWCNWESETYSGCLAGEARFMPEDGSRHAADIRILPATFVMADSVWNVGGSRILVRGREVDVRDFSIRKGEEYLSVDGRISEDPEARLHVGLKGFDLARLAHVLLPDDHGICGTIGGNVYLKDYYGDCLLLSEFDVGDWGLEGDVMGSLKFSSYWDAASGNLMLGAKNRVGSEIPLSVSGYYNPGSDSLEVTLGLEKIGMERIGKYSSDLVSDTRGSLSGRLDISGTSRSPRVSGFISLDSVGVRVNALNTAFSLCDSILIRDSRLVFEDFGLEDREGNRAGIDGEYDLWNSRYQLKARFQDFMVMDNGMGDNESLYGRVSLSGLAEMDNADGTVNLTVNARTEDNSVLYIPLSASQTEQSDNFLHFSLPEAGDDRKPEPARRYSGVNLNANLELDDNLDVQLIFDPTVGDILRTRGNGNIKLAFDKDGSLSMFGDYRISKGDYLFTLSNLVNKKFVLTPGGVINWSGSPYEANLDVNAVYRLKTTIAELLPEGQFSDQDGDGEKGADPGRKVPVECILNLSGRLTDPKVRFDIGFPSLENQSRSYIQSLFSSQDEVNKQMFSLLVLNRFYRTDNTGDYGNQAQTAGVTTLTEMMSNQLSRWFSQFSENLDIGIAYRVGDRDRDMGSDEIELALSTQLLNDRVTISANGNMDVGRRNDTGEDGRNNIAGDFDVEVKLNRQGTLKMKAYSHTDEKILYNSMETIQGIGVSYQESFDTLRELLRKYFGFLKRDGRDRKKGR